MGAQERNDPVPEKNDDWEIRSAPHLSILSRDTGRLGRSTEEVQRTGSSKDRYQFRNINFHIPEK